jgi:hypothetical protein
VFKKLGIAVVGILGFFFLIGIVGTVAGGGSSKPAASAATQPNSSSNQAASQPIASNQSGSQRDSARNSQSAAKLGTKENPVPFGQTFTVSDKGRTYEVSVLDVQRVDEAGAKRVNMFNSAPTAGNEYLFVKMHLKYISGKDSYKTPASGASVLYQGRMWGEKLIVGPEPKFAGVDLFEGGEADGWLSALEIPEGASPLVLNWGQGIFGGGGNWFELPPNL